MENRTLYALYCATVVSLGGFVFGFDASVISGVVGFVSVEFDLTPIQSGFVVAAPTLSGVFGTMVIGPLSDALGRKKVLLVIAFLYLLSALASAFASSYMMLVTARAIGGSSLYFSDDSSNVYCRNCPGATKRKIGLY